MTGLRRNFCIFAVVIQVVTVGSSNLRAQELGVKWTNHAAGQIFSWSGATGDIDGDGTVDLVTAESVNGPSAYVGIRRASDGQRVFLGADEIYCCGTLYSIDIDNDGLQDVIAPETSSGTVFIRVYGKTGGVLGPKWSRDLNIYGHPSLFFADLLGDGRREIVVTAMGTSSLTILAPLDGSILYAAGSCSTPPNCNPTTVTFLDVDGDSVTDLLAKVSGEFYCIGKAPTVSVEGSPASPLLATKLQAPTPNPATNNTTISFDLAERDRVKLELFDASGRRVRRLLDATLLGGRHQATWDARDQSGSRVPSGLYWCRLTTSTSTQSVQLVRIAQ